MPVITNLMDNLTSLLKHNLEYVCFLFSHETMEEIDTPIAVVLQEPSPNQTLKLQQKRQQQQLEDQKLLEKPQRHQQPEHAEHPRLQQQQLQQPLPQEQQPETGQQQQHQQLESSQQQQPIYAQPIKKANFIPQEEWPHIRLLIKEEKNLLQKKYFFVSMTSENNF